MTKIKTQRGISLSRVLLAIFTCGLSIPFVGIRRVRTTTITNQPYAPSWGPPTG